MAVDPLFFYTFIKGCDYMDAIYRDAYPDIFATFDDDFGTEDFDLLTLATEDNVDKD